MLKNRNNVAMIFFIIFVVSLIFSYAFCAFSSEHQCIGEECKTCYEINLMKNIFENLLILLVISAFIKKVEHYMARKKYIGEITYHLTLIKLKVEMTE